MSRALGEFEQLVLLATLHLGEGAYGAPIVAAIEERTARSVDRTAVYVTLRRLEARGLVTSHMSEPRAERGGKPRRMVQVTPAGAQALIEARKAIDGMWQGLDPRLSTLLGD